MMYFTIAKNECGYLIDSISENYNLLKNKFPDEKIYYSDKPIINIYVILNDLKLASWEEKSLNQNQE